MGDGSTPAHIRSIGTAASLLLGAAVLLMSVQVVLRFGFNAPQAWAEEVDRYFFIWSVYLGSIIALVKDTHIRVTVLVDPFGAPGKRASDFLNRWLTASCCAFVGYFAWQFAYHHRADGFYTIPDLPQVVFFLSVPVSMTLMVIYMVMPMRR